MFSNVAAVISDRRRPPHQRGAGRDHAFQSDRRHRWRAALPWHDESPLRAARVLVLYEGRRGARRWSVAAHEDLAVHLRVADGRPGFPRLYAHGLPLHRLSCCGRGPIATDPAQIKLTPPTVGASLRRK